ncbi:hypothetical protein GCM10011331_14320 [Flavimobilis marinus]|uniref:Uncharacterized protein n=1 Tax=Flavimobilis marinus TaxID=285351 RepID=A0A1I2FW19_9MICO|nr:hypothetical protein [Flavimobilis marinus]GHG51096.1 hypothetical protein GCM10011331_14320 [Flavimobilis marinus]SFF08967.1 hypothetical protein SAMN04488035_1533 [Flavimobilis marinus]
MRARPSLSPDAAALLRQLTHERPLAVAHLADGGWVAATRSFIVTSSGAAEASAREWVDVDRASLDPETRTLTVSWADGTGTSALVFADDTAAQLTLVLREQVQSSVVLAESLKLPGGAVARVAVRRRPSGELFSQVIGDARVNLADPDTARVVGACEARLREASGLPL